MNLFPGLTKAADLAAGATEVEKALSPAPKHGPQGKVRFISPGRQASRIRRRQVAEKRKINTRYRRDWMKNRIAVSRLRGQLEALDRFNDLHGVVDGLPHCSPEAYQAIVDDLSDKFGSVDAAYDRYATIMAEQAA